MRYYSAKQPVEPVGFAVSDRSWSGIRIPGAYAESKNVLVHPHAAYSCTVPGSEDTGRIPPCRSVDPGEEARRTGLYGAALFDSPHFTVLCVGLQTSGDFQIICTPIESRLWSSLMDPRYGFSFASPQRLRKLVLHGAHFFRPESMGKEERQSDLDHFASP